MEDYGLRGSRLYQIQYTTYASQWLCITFTKHTAASLTHKHGQLNNDDGHHIHHTSTQHHRREQLLAGWERVQLQNGESTATPPRRGSNEKKA